MKRRDDRTIRVRTAVKIMGVCLLCGMCLLGCGGGGGGARGRLGGGKSVNDVLQQQTAQSDPGDNVQSQTGQSQMANVPSGKQTEADRGTTKTGMTQDEANRTAGSARASDLFDEQQRRAAGFSQKVDLDMSKDSAELVFATLFQFGADPDSYVGKRMLMSGTYHALFDDRTGKYYHYCLVTDLTACCVQGIEFVWDDGTHVYPDEYPQENAPILVEGTFETYREDGIDTLFSRLSSAKLLYQK